MTSPADRATKLCTGCGIILDRDAAVCPRCRTVQPDAPAGIVAPPPDVGSQRRYASLRTPSPAALPADHLPLAPHHGSPALADAETDRRILPAFLLCFFLGVFGAHRFYAGKAGTGVLQACTLGGLGIWMLVDLIMIVSGAFTDGRGRRITQWT